MTDWSEDNFDLLKELKVRRTSRRGETEVICAKAVERIEELQQVLKAMVDEYCEYNIINNLGDPEKQHNIKWARKFIPFERVPDEWHARAKRNMRSMT